VLETEGFPWSSSLGVALRRDPSVHDLLLLLRVAAEGYPRAGTAEVLGSPRLRWAGVLPDEPQPRADRARSLSLQAGILGGLEEWTQHLPAWAQRNVPSDEADAEALGRALAALDRRIEPLRARTWREHADLVERLIHEVLPGAADSPAAPAVEALLEIVEEMRILPAFLGDERVSLREMLEWLESAVDERELPASPESASGVQVLDAMQARGLTFRRVHILGLHTGLFPRQQRSDPFLSDGARKRLRAVTSKPISIKADSEKEERLLLALLLGSAGEELCVSWQRADDAGRARSPSLGLREVARLALGSSELDVALKKADPLPAHPAQAIERLVEATGLLPPREDLLLAALREDNIGAAADALESRSPELAPRLAMLRATESFKVVDPRWDGRVDPRHVAAKSFGVRRLETLGRCPLRYFFQHVLAVSEPDPETGPFEPESRELGNRVHSVLERVYRTLKSEKRFEATESDSLRRRDLELLASEWEKATRDLEQTLGRRVPVLWRVTSESWLQSLERFVADDLERLAARGLRPEAFEETRREKILLSKKTSIEVRARFDRRFSAGDETLVSDYKTGKVDVASLCSVTEMLRGHRLQVPLYWILAGNGAWVEVLGVGPEHQGAEAETKPAKPFGGFEDEARERGFLETLEVLVDLARKGRFPIRTADCPWCPYASACRHNHPPTEEREGKAKDAEKFHALEKKSLKAPRLAETEP